MRQEASAAVGACAVASLGEREVLDPAQYQAKAEGVDAVLKALNKQMAAVGRGIERYESIFGVRAEKLGENALRFELLPLENAFVELSVQGGRFALQRSSPFLHDAAALMEELNGLQRLDLFLLRFIERATTTT